MKLSAVWQSGKKWLSDNLSSFNIFKSFMCWIIETQFQNMFFSLNNSAGDLTVPSSRHKQWIYIFLNEKTSDFFMQPFFLNSLKNNQCLLIDTHIRKLVFSLFSAASDLTVPSRTHKKWIYFWNEKKWFLCCLSS